MIKSFVNFIPFIILVMVLFSSFGFVKSNGNNPIEIPDKLVNNSETRNISKVPYEKNSNNLVSSSILEFSAECSTTQFNNNNLNKFGNGNNTLLKANETFSVQETSTISNSIISNKTSASQFVSNPTYTNYNLAFGNYTINNSKSIYGINTVEGSTKVSYLSYSTYSEIASSFSVSNQLINISSLTIYLNESAASGNKQFNLYIYGLKNLTVNSKTVYAPNGTLWFQKTGLTPIQQTAPWYTLSFSPLLNLTKGTYAVVIKPTSSNTFYYPVVMDNSSGDGVNESYMWTMKPSQSWNVSEYPADLSFYFSYINLNPNNRSEVYAYSNPASVNFKINGSSIDNFSKIYNALPMSGFNVSTNVSVSFNVNYYLIFRRINLLPVSTFYNSTINTNYWAVNFTIASFTTFANSIVVRNFSINYIPSDWIFFNQIYNGTSSFSPNQFSFVQSSPTFWFLVSNSASNGNFKIIFTSPNYAQSINLYDNNSNLYSNFTLTGNKNYYTIGNMAFNPTNNLNTTLFLETSKNIIIKNYTSPTFNQNHYIFPVFNISEFFNLNSSYQGEYKLILNWSNPNLTKIGYYEQPIYFVISTKLTVQTPKTQYYIGDYISLTANVTDSFNRTVYSNYPVNYTADWKSQGYFSFNNLIHEFQVNFSSFAAFQGDHAVIISATGPYIVNQSRTLTIHLNSIPTSLQLISKSGFTNVNKNSAQLSSILHLVYNFTNLLNSSYISNLPIIYLNGNPINLSTNTLGISMNTTGKISIDINLDPQGTNKTWVIGSYNLTILIDKHAFALQQKQFIFSITGYSLNINLIYSNQYFIPGQIFNVKAVLSPPGIQNISTFFKILSNPFYNIYLAGINLTLTVNATFLSGVNNTFYYKSITDNSGSAYFEISGNITQNLKSINSIEVSSTGNNIISDLDQKESSLNIVNVYLQSAKIATTTIPIIPIIFGFLLIIGSIILLGGGIFLYRNYSNKSLKENQVYNDYLNSITDFLGMYITNKEGLPIFLKSNQRLEDQNQHLILSGVTYSIDIFLNNFKNEYMTKIIKEENIEGSPNTGLVHTTVINQ